MSKKLIILFSLPLMFGILGLLYYQKSQFIPLKKLSAQNCDQLPLLSEIKTEFIKYDIEVSKLLENLMSCQNNSAVCEKFSKCIEKDFQKNTIRAGNSIIEWRPVAECTSQKKGAIVFSYTSGCEMEFFLDFLENNQDFRNFHFDYYNY